MSPSGRQYARNRRAPLRIGRYMAMRVVRSVRVVGSEFIKDHGLAEAATEWAP